ncbi:MAG: PKD domain-containing protein [Bacteroidia bacterium]|nr:PKD domain-containing protein [Bacteroidia bacterium]
MRAKSNLLLLLFIAIGTVAFPQYQSYNYYIAFSGKYFKSDGKNGVQRGDNPKFIHPQSNQKHVGYCTVSESNGNLKYYSDGISVFDNNNKKLSGGLTLETNDYLSIEKYIFQLKGSENNYCLLSFFQSVLYIQIFNKNGIYRIDSLGFIEKIEGGIGVFNHCSTKGNWIITKPKLVNQYKVYYIDTFGISLTPVISNFSSQNLLSHCNHIYGGNSRIFAVASSQTGINSPFDVYLFDFNQSNGSIKMNRKILSGVSQEKTKDVRITIPFFSFSPNCKYLYFFGFYLPNENDKTTNSASSIFRYNLENEKTELVFTSSARTFIKPKGFNLLNPKQLVYSISSGFTIAEVGYSYTPQSRLFSIEMADQTLVNDIIFKDFVVTADTLEDFVLNGITSQNYLPVQESTLQIKVSCIPEKSTFTVESKLPIYDVKWDLGDGTFLSGSSSISHAYAKPGVYFVKALVKLCGQVDTLLDTLVVEQKPDLSYLRDTSICEGSSVQFFRPANHPGIWNNTDTNSVFVCNQEGKYSFTVENSCGLFTQTFEVKTVKPFLQNPPQELISCGNIPQLKTTQLANKYLWNTGSTSPEILADTPGLYVLKLANNCFTGTEEFLVKNPAQQSNIVLPNAITTNADGLNENWQPIITGIQRFTYSIYSRWGDLIFSGNEQNPVWYPNANNSGVYLVELAYQPDCKEIQHKKGTITIIK